MSQGPLVQQFLEERDAILGFVLALTRDYDVAEEVFQEVARVILEEAGRATPVTHFMAWVREIARRRVGEYYRKNARRNSVEHLSGTIEEVVSLAFEENEKTLETSQSRFKALGQCLEELRGRSRAVIDGFYRSRHSIREISSILGWTENSVKTALWRSRKALADCIERKLQMQETPQK